MYISGIQKLYFSSNGQPEIQISICGCDFKHQESNLERARLSPVAKMVDLSD